MTTKLKRTYDAFLESSSPCNRILFSQDAVEQIFPPRKKLKVKIRDDKENQILLPNKIEYSKKIISNRLDNKIKELILEKRKKKNLYTEEEVKYLIKEREDQLHEEYTKALQERLQEQFNSFTQFNQDYISTLYQDKDFSYTS
jgi:hypothetical protein